MQELFGNWASSTYSLATVFGLVMFVIRLIMLPLLVGLAQVFDDADIYDDDDADDSHGGWIAKLLTVNGLSSMALGGGLAGIISYRTLPTDMAWVSLPIALACGLGVAVMLYYLVRLLLKLQSSGSLDADFWIGATGQVYNNIPVNDFGRVTVIKDGRMEELVARCPTARSVIKTGTPVLVTGMDGHVASVVVNK